MSKENEEKWSCEICTYENWPLSLKCTMCRSKKPLLGEDIYKLREERQEKNTLEIDPEGYLESGKKNRPGDNRREACYNGARAITPEITLSTWQCSTCTFVNSENSLNCLQCDTTRLKSNKNINNSPKIDVDKTKLVYKNSNYENDKVESNNIRKISKSNSQNLSFTSDKIAITKSNSQNILEGKDRNKLYKTNSNNKSPDRWSPQNVEGNSPQNVIIETESEAVDSNILSETLEKSPSGRYKNNRSQNKNNTVNEDVDNVQYLSKFKGSISLNSQSNQVVRGNFFLKKKKIKFD